MTNPSTNTFTHLLELSDPDQVRRRADRGIAGLLPGCRHEAPLAVVTDKGLASLPMIADAMQA